MATYRPLIVNAANEFGAKDTTQTSTDVGSGNYHENRPPYYALAFIMRTL